MARYRLSGPAKADIVSILRTSETQHGKDARSRYRVVFYAVIGLVDTIATHSGLIAPAGDGLEGDVLEFELEGHPTAARCYAWEVDGVVTAVLGEPPVESPQDAVRASIMAGSGFDRPGLD